MEVRSVEAIVRALNEANVRYLIVGGLAVNAHGYERLTVDVDLVINLEPENIIQGLRALQQIGYQTTIPVTPEQFADATLRESWRTEKNMVVLKLWSDVHRRTLLTSSSMSPLTLRLNAPRRSLKLSAPASQRL